MERCKRARDRTVMQLKAIKLFSEKIGNATTLEALQIREENCKKLYKDFNDYELELLAFEDYEANTEGIDDMFLNTLALLRAAINTRTSEQKVEVCDLNATLGQFIGQQQTFLQGMSHTQNVRLPKINIEPFAGDYKLWPSFHDLGDAATLIRHIKVTEQNYEEAWAKLVDRYNKPKAIIFSLIQLFLDQRNCGQANHRDLRKLCDSSDEVIRGLRALGDLAETRDPWLIHILVGKVDSETKQLWAKESVDDAFPNFDKFLKFLSTRCDALESCVANTKTTGAVPKHVRSLNTTQTNKWNCIACKQDHSLYKCPLFKSMNVESRYKIMENAKSCTNCLRTGHLQPQCFSRAVCLICQRRHHSLLHNDPQSIVLHVANEQQSTRLQPNDNTITNINRPSSIASASHQINTENHLQSTSKQHSTINTVTTHIQSSNGELMLVRALLDSGSQSSFISESCMQRLGLRRKYSHISIYGLASSSAGKTRGETVITVKSRTVPQYIVQITVHIIEKISSPLPATKVLISQNNELWQLDLADPHFIIPSAVDILIGAEFFLDMLREQKMNLNDLPVLHSSKFGWLIAGKIHQDESNCTSVQNYNAKIDSIITNENLLELLKKFWQVEEPITDIKPGKDEDPCEVLFQKTTTRSADGRFIVRLPFVDPRPELGDSFSSAKSRMVAIEKRFARSANYHQEYKEFIEEYIGLDQIQCTTWSELPKENNDKYFMPHHAVFKESTTTKLRVVFDASCKTTTEVSLNDCLLTGPKLQPDLTTTLHRFRLHKVAINADIEKMYRQILVDPSDANFQCILWRKNPEEQLSPYKCKTVTYGTACVPFLAIRTLEELARNYETTYPNAARAIRSQFYMDDLLTGSNTVEDAIILKRQINEIIESCGFRLRTWKSNSKEFLQSLEMDNTENIPKLIEDD